MYKYVTRKNIFIKNMIFLLKIYFEFFQTFDDSVNESVVEGLTEAEL